MWILNTVLVSILCVLGISCNEKKPEQSPPPLLGIKMICVWSVQADDAQEVDSAVVRAGELGFNAVCWNREAVPEACRRQGMQSFYIVCPLDRRPEAQLQVLAPGENRLTGFRRDSIPVDHFYQYGGEPAEGNREILDQNFSCPNDRGVIDYTLKQVAAAVESGYDGIVFDFVGYRNYHSCQCPMCLEGLAGFRRQHPEMADSAAAVIYYESLLLELYDTLYVAIKNSYPDLIVANHIHPVFLPDIFYGLKVNTDYCGITVSWFFKPHWTLEKVADYTRTVVRGPYRHSGVQGMPMVGFYTDSAFERDRKSPQRLAREFEILKKQGARHLMMCELGHIIRDHEIADVVKNALSTD